MSLARAFTTRRIRSDKPGANFLGRTASQRSPRSPAKDARLLISGPINLISSTNVLAYEAPDIVGTVPTPLAGVQRSVSSGSSTASSRDSGDHSDASSNSLHSAGTLTDASSVGSSPSSPEPNHLSCYFKPSVYTDGPSRSNSMRSSSHTSLDAPAIPRRAASHSKKAHMHVSRQRSISRLRTPPSTALEFSREPTDFVRSEPSHPFGKELEQLNEVVEEFGGVVRDAEADADHVFMEAHGLGYFCATDYIMEINNMIDEAFREDYEFSEQAGWI